MTSFTTVPLCSYTNTRGPLVYTPHRNYPLAHTGIVEYAGNNHI